MTRRRQRGAALLIGGLLAVGFTLCAAFQVATWTVGPVERTSHQVIPGPVRELRVDAGAGDIRVVAGSGDEVRVDATVKGSFRTPELRAVKDGDTVRVDGDCPDVFGIGPCRASMVIHLPAGATVDVSSGAGDLTATGLSGPVRLSTGSGDVHASELTGDVNVRAGSGDLDLRGLRGTVDAKTGSGDIEADGLFAPQVQAVAYSGDVELAFASVPRDVDATTASGDVDVTLPDGFTYRVEADTGSGDQRVAVRTDPAATRVVRARTSSGDISVAYGTD